MPRDNGWTAPADGKATIITPSAPLTVAKTFLDHAYCDSRHTRLIRYRGTFYRWDGAVWAELGEEPLRAKIYDFLAGCFRSGEKGLDPVHPNTRLVNEVLSALRAAAIIDDAIELPAWIGENRGGKPDPNEIVVFRNGLLHLPTRVFDDPTPELFALNALDVDGNPEAPVPRRWLSFLEELWPGDPESIDALQKMFGYALTCDTRLQKALMIVGPSRSGKGTIGHVLTAIVGARNVVFPTLADLGRQFGREPLVGKRLAIVGDAKIGRDADPVAIAEHLLGITGEDGVTIDRKGKAAWTGRLPLKIVVLCTEVPRMTDDSAGIAYRFLILRLVKSFLGMEDRNLTSKLLAELPGIVAWAVEGWHRLAENGGEIAQPQSAQGHVDDIKNTASLIKLYLDERCDFHPNYTVERDALYLDYSSWCDTQRIRVCNKVVFGRKLRTAFPELGDYHPRADECGVVKRHRHYAGLRLQQ